MLVAINPVNERRECEKRTDGGRKGDQRGTSAKDVKPTIIITPVGQGSSSRQGNASLGIIGWRVETQGGG